MRKRALYELTRDFLKNDDRSVLWIDCEKFISRIELKEFLKDSGLSEGEIQESLLRIQKICPKSTEALLRAIFHGIQLRIPGLVILTSPLHLLGWSFRNPKGNSIQSQSHFLKYMMKGLRENCRDIGPLGIVSNDIMEKDPASGTNRSIFGEVASENFSKTIFLDKK